MGKVPGVAAGYESSSAIVNGIPMLKSSAWIAFYGPGMKSASVIFPHNPDAERWTIQEWLKFDYNDEVGTI